MNINEVMPNGNVRVIVPIRLRRVLLSSEIIHLAIIGTLPEHISRQH